MAHGACRADQGRCYTAALVLCRSFRQRVLKCRRNRPIICHATMNDLLTYIGAIFNLPSQAVIERRDIAQSSWQEDGFDVRQEVPTYYFSNGVVVRRTSEEDSFPSQAACAECWITYEVPSNGQAPVEVLPAVRRFDSRCREAFWLKFHSAN